MKTALRRTLLVLACAFGAQPAAGQHFHYVEPGVAACPAAPVPPVAAPKVVQQGVAVRGGIHVACGFDQGSYTVTLNATDPAASFSRKTFVVNFGRLVGGGAFAVTFSTLGVHRVSAAITSNMGSPAVQGHFVSADHEFKVVVP